MEVIWQTPKGCDNFEAQKPRMGGEQWREKWCANCGVHVVHHNNTPMPVGN